MANIVHSFDRSIVGLSENGRFKSRPDGIAIPRPLGTHTVRRDRRHTVKVAAARAIKKHVPTVISVAAVVKV